MSSQAFATEATGTRVDPRERHREMQWMRVRALGSHGLLEHHVGPLVPAASGAWETEVVQLGGSGPATVEIRRGGRVVAYAKLLGEGIGSVDAAACEQTAQRLRAVHGGFHAGASRVVRPLGYLRQYRCLLTEPAPGVSVSRLQHQDPVALVRACRSAGEWLATFHDKAPLVGAPKPVVATTGLAALAGRFAKATAAEPSSLPVTLELLDLLGHLAQEASEGEEAQCHGQFRPAHLFVDPGSGVTTAIDLDLTAPGDPARDVAEFWHRIRMSVVKHSGSFDLAEATSEAFLEAYRAGSARATVPTNFTLHRVRFLAHTFARELRRGVHEGPRSVLVRRDLAQVLGEGATERRSPV